MIIGITGHRPNKLNNEYNLNGPVSKYIRQKCQNIIDTLSPDALVSGLALGVDTIWAMLAIKNDIRLIAAVPFIGQEKIWPESSKLLYREILDHPNTKIVIVSEGGYSPQKMQIRNEWMVDHSDIMIAIWDGTSGGTGNCVKYIKKCKKELTIINPQNYQKDEIE